MRESVYDSDFLFLLYIYVNIYRCIWRYLCKVYLMCCTFPCMAMYCLISSLYSFLRCIMCGLFNICSRKSDSEENTTDKSPFLV